MFKFRFMAYMIGAVIMFSSFDVQKCADSLKAAYDAKDYDAYVDAFPDKYEDFVKVYGYDHKNGVKTILYDCSYEHIDFLFSSERDSGFPQRFDKTTLSSLPPLSDYTFSVSEIESKIGGEFSFFPLAPAEALSQKKISDWPGLQEVSY